jgi:hypothetical protein
VFIESTGEFIREISGHRDYYTEEDGRVYLHRNSQQKALLYDFTLKVGDSLRVNNSITQKVIEVDTILVRDRYRRRLYLLETGRSQQWPDKNYQTVVIWVEGVGSVWGLVQSHHDFQTLGGYELFSTLSEDGNLMFTNDDFYADPVHYVSPTEDGIDSPLCTPRLRSQDMLFDLQGRLLKDVPQQGIYIKDGKKRVVR